MCKVGMTVWIRHACTMRKILNAALSSKLEARCEMSKVMLDQKEYVFRL